MEEREERVIQIMGLVLSVISIAIGSVFILFFIGVSRVDAYTTAKSNIWINGQRCINNDWNGIGTLSCINNNYDYYTLRTDTSLNMTAGKKYTFYWKAQVTMHMKYSSGTSNIDNLYVSYNRGGTLGDITSCSSNYSRTNTGNDKIYNITVSCKDVQFSTTTDAITVRVYFDNSGILTSPGMVAKLTQIYLEETGTDNSDVTNAIDNSTTSIINNNNNNTNSIINNNNSNTNSIINNNNQNTQEIINNQNANSQAEIESQKVCTYPGLLNTKNWENGYLNTAGNIERPTMSEKTSEYIKVTPNTQYTIKLVNATPTTDYWFGIALYNTNKEFINRNISAVTTNNYYTFYTGPTTEYIKFSARFITDKVKVQIVQGTNDATTEICENGNQQIGNLMQDIMEMNNWEHQTPDSGNLNDVEDLEDDIGEYLTDPVDMDDLDYEIDTTTNETIWQIFDDIVTGNSTYLATFLSILFCGIVKLILAR